MIYDFYDKNIFTKNYTFHTFNNYYNCRFNHGFTMPMHSHKYIEIMYNKKGTSIVETLSRKYRLETGDYILINGDVSHKLYVDKKAAASIIMFEFNFIEKTNDIVTPSKILESSSTLKCLIENKPDLLKLKDNGQILNLLDILYWNPQNTVLIQQILFTFYILLSSQYVKTYHTKDGESNIIIENAKKYMHHHFNEPINISDISRSINCNKSYFHKLFLKHQKKTPLAYLMELRMDYAKLLLQNSDMSIMDVAIYSGFSSRQHFSATFKKYFSISPKKYRTLQLENNQP